jgi:hypothetical protein
MLNLSKAAKFFSGGSEHLNYVRVWRKDSQWQLVVDLCKAFPWPNE